MSGGEGWTESAYLSPDVSRTVVEDARRASPDEACGLLVGRIQDGDIWVTRAISCPNEAPADRRRTRFTIDPRQVIEEERSLRGTGHEIVGFYHSHPAGQPVPSSIDRGYMELWPEVLWLIVGEDASDDWAAMGAWRWNPAAPGSPRRVPVSELSEVRSRGEERYSSARTTSADGAL